MYNKLTTNKLTEDEVRQLELDKAYAEGCMKIPMSDKETQRREITLGKCVPSGGMPINGLESSTPVQVKVKEIALTDKVIKMAEGISQLNYQVREINSRLFRQEPNSGTISSGDPSCIDEYIHLISDGILEANEMLCNIVNKL